MINFRRAIPTTVDRVQKSTSDAINERIRMRTQQNVAKYAAHPAEIQKRLDQLDAEWDIERTLEANAAVVGLTGLLLGMKVNKKFFVLPIAVGTFLFQHAVQGWCPPVPLFRRLGVRTQKEIEHERFALKAIRGDFARAPAFGQENPEVTALETLKAAQ